MDLDHTGRWDSAAAGHILVHNVLILFRVCKARRGPASQYTPNFRPSTAALSLPVAFTLRSLSCSLLWSWPAFSAQVNMLDTPLASCHLSVCRHGGLTHGAAHAFNVRLILACPISLCTGQFTLIAVYLATDSVLSWSFP